MAKSVLVRVSLVRAALLGATALSLFSAPFTIGDAAAKVGVTSATDGDPLGKPPQAAERVLRIGIDVQANELITTNANDRAHLLFLDGSSLTVGPNAQLTIDKFVFDPSTKTGELAINASKGVLRLVGGKISKSSPITITTPSSTIGIRGGITILDVKARQTESTFVFGKDMTVRGGSQTQVATRPGSMIVTNFGSPPGMPTILAQGALTAQLGALEGRRAPQGGGSGGGGGGGRNPDQVAQSSGLSGVNSSQSVRIIAPGVPDNFGSGPGPRNLNPSDTIVTALSNSNQSQQDQTGLQTLKEQQVLQQQPQAQQPTFFEGLPPPPGSSPGSSPDSPNPGTNNPGNNQFSIAPNSRFTTGAELNQLNQQNASATFSGQIRGLVGNNPVNGTYSNVWSFGARQGVASIAINGSTYGGGSTANTFQQGSSRFFDSNALPSTSGPTGRTATVHGTFLSTPTQHANQQIGVISLAGPGNQGGGVFIGSR